MRPSPLLAVLLLMAAVALLAPGPLRAEMRLLMFEQPGCSWCRAWNEEVGDAYAKTEEGRRAPLERVLISEGVPEGMELESRPRFTPTFVLVEDGREIGRIEGYPGEEFFWSLLGMLLERAP